MRFIELNSRLRLANAVTTFLLCGLCLVTVGCQTKEQKITAALQRCQSLLDRDDLDAATKCYAAAVKADSIS